MKKVNTLFANISVTVFLVLSSPFAFSDTPSACSANSAGNYGCGNPNGGGEPTSSSSCDSYYMPPGCQCNVLDTATYERYGYATQCSWTASGSSGSCSDGGGSCSAPSSEPQYGDSCGCGTN